MAKSNTNVIFPAFSGAISNLTAEFASEDSLIMIQAKGLKSGDEVLIEVAFADECDIVTWIPFVDCCGQVKLKYPQTFLILPIPLRYRGVLIDVNGNYMTDPSHFSGVEIRSNRIYTNTDLTKFYHGCCTTSNSETSSCNVDAICDGISAGGVSPSVCNTLAGLPNRN